jgi:hypothetical protein
MSASNQMISPSASTDSFIAIFDAASIEYQRITGKRLEIHPFATQLDACDSPKTFSDILQTQAQAFNKFRKSDHQKLMVWLDRIVHILFTFSAILGEGIDLVSSHLLRSMGMFSKVWPQPFSPAKMIFTGLRVLLKVKLSPCSLSRS